MKKNLKDYTQYKLDEKDILNEAYNKCIREMYAKAQPSADYDEIIKYYKECREHNLQPERIFLRHYLSHEEYEYIKNKYIKAYRLEDQFKENCDIIKRDIIEGYYTDDYISHTNSSGFETKSHISKKIPPLATTLGQNVVNTITDFIEDRKHYYRFDRGADQFTVNIGLNDSPISNPETVVEYWKSIGINIEIDPRHYTEDDFWDEEHGYFEEDETEV